MKEKMNKIFKTVFQIDNNIETFKKDGNDKWDSINHLNLIVEIESEFDIDIDPDDMQRIKDFDSALIVVKSKINL